LKSSGLKVHPFACRLLTALCCWVATIPSLPAQLEHQKWHFGYGASLDFSSGSPLPTAGSAMNTDEGCSSICDGAGNLLFYTNGMEIWNRNHQTMPNGTGLSGHFSTSQSALIVKVRGADSLYLVFTVAAQVSGNWTGLAWSMVDMGLDNGLGDVIQKNTLLCDSTTEKLCAVRAANGSDVWVLAHRWDSDAFYAYRVTCADSNGLPQVVGPVISQVGSVHLPDSSSIPTASSIGCMKISPDGRRLALVWARYRNTTSADSDASVEWFDFDPQSGIVSNPAQLDIPDLRAYGVAFSPSSRFLYVSTYGLPNGIGYSDIRQYDLQSANVQASAFIVRTGDPEFGTLQLGPDNRLYAARLSFVNYISAITQPDSQGAACGYLDLGADLGAGMSTWGLPNHWDHYNPPQVWTFQDTGICAWESFSIIANVAGGQGWLWSNGGNVYANTFNDTGLVWVEIYLACDTLRDSFHLSHIFCDPAILPERTAEVCQDDAIRLDATQQGALAYTWRNGETGPVISTADTGWMWVEVHFQHDTIRDSIHLSRRECECVIAQNAFSPNGDGMNDVFQPRVDCTVEYYLASVFDRWGRRMFTTSNPNLGWNGETGGGPVPESVYYYVIEWKQHAGTLQRKPGSLLLVR
jgi:gliding motility-associated-like protein